ncbi:hypothetical protein BTVI_46894 [Pitangus sulphuratus]|nr:hypothetical protein BTVI_46894 [Pitangus sulphuratus]
MILSQKPPDRFYNNSSPHTPALYPKVWESSLSLVLGKLPEQPPCNLRGGGQAEHDDTDDSDEATTFAKDYQQLQTNLYRD